MERTLAQSNFDMLDFSKQGRLGDLMRKKFHEDNQSIEQLICSAKKEIEEVQKRSVEHKFEFKNWVAGLGSEFYEARAPEPRDFRHVKSNEFFQILNFYCENNFAAAAGPCDSSTGCIPTLQCEFVTSNICNFIAKVDWSSLDRHLKIASWLLLCGFDDNFRDPQDVKFPVKKISSCTDYLISEEKRSNMFRVETFPWPESNTVICDYFCIQEQKRDNNGEPYVKDRFVANMVKANQQIQDKKLAQDLSYNFKTAETIFTDICMYEKLVSSKFLTVVDKSDYLLLYYYRTHLLVSKRIVSKQ